MKYDNGTGDLQNWVVAEGAFEQRYQGKAEVVMCLGNGYMGVRSATEEGYTGQVRNTFVAGTFNQAHPTEVTELPNVADVAGIDIAVDGQALNLTPGTFASYNRELNLKNGQLLRTFIWTTSQGKKVRFTFKRMVSFAHLHTMATQITIEPLVGAVTIAIKSGINGQVTNSGAQHFAEGEKRIYEGKYLQMLQQTTQSGIDFVHNTVHEVNAAGIEVDERFEMDRRKVLMVYEATLQAGKALSLTKISNVYTSRDADAAGLNLPQLRQLSLQQLKTEAAKGYQGLLAASAQQWATYWQQMDIQVQGTDHFDQLAIRFAQYHLLTMAPAHDNRYGIAAKGLSGEGYKGHSFWDSEIFIVPFFIYTYPQIARSLLEYRYNTLAGARKKARENGYAGAMYPWESAWADDGEVTPVWGAVDIVTGEATKIWSGFIEQHITADVAFAVWQYYQVTADEDFMERYGYEILIDTGIFWASRLQWNEAKGEYHINDVVGPDEYKEHVNNDAFTNYMARWCMENAIQYSGKLKAEKPALYARLNAQLGLDEAITNIKNRFNKVYLPQPNAQGVIPQDDTYLGLKQIDLTKYKNQSHVGSIFRDYNLHQVNHMQVSKQASVVMLMYLLEHQVSREVKVANYKYYEPRTLHDSSLSLSTHAVLAADVNDTALAYSLFQRAARIDLGPAMKSSDHGIHAASIGGIWQIIVCGFGGVRMVGGHLRIDPRLPQQIQAITYPIHWQGNPLKITVTHQAVTVVNQGSQPVQLTIHGQALQVSTEATHTYAPQAEAVQV